jgi:hypothetical protein
MSRLSSEMISLDLKMFLKINFTFNITDAKSVPPQDMKQKSQLFLELNINSCVHLKNIIQNVHNMLRM